MAKIISVLVDDDLCLTRCNRPPLVVTAVVASISISNFLLDILKEDVVVLLGFFRVVKKFVGSRNAFTILKQRTASIMDFRWSRLCKCRIIIV
jgi:hypothetical protein